MADDMGYAGLSCYGNRYFKTPHLDRLAIPIRFLHGAENSCFKPASTERTIETLKQVNDPGLYDRFVIPDYGHIDCIYGKNAVDDVYPKILEHLEKSAQK